MALAFPAHLADFTMFNRSWEKPLFLWLVTIPTKRFPSSQSQAGEWGGYSLMFMSKSCSEPAIHHFIFSCLGCSGRDHHSPVACCHDLISRVFQVWGLISHLIDSPKTHVSISGCLRLPIRRLIEQLLSVYLLWKSAAQTRCSHPEGAQ